jgi:hypothetical protein
VLAPAAHNSAQPRQPWRNQDQTTPKQQGLTDQEHEERQQKHPRLSRATSQHEINEKTQDQTVPRDEMAQQENQASRERPSQA